MSDKSREDAVAATIASTEQVGTSETVATGPGPAIDPRLPVKHALGSVPAPGTARGDFTEPLVVSPDNYVMEGPLAAGGMGRILKARDRRLGRVVAIKELHAQTPELLARFRREAQITARLQHPSIVTIHEAGAWPSGEPFFAMELVTGKPFDAMIAAATTPAARLRLLKHALDVADALAYAHSKGVIHRDLKPGNVLVGEFGETVVIDWGLARDRFGDDSLTRSRPSEEAGATDILATAAGSVLGTPAYMAPEQAAGDRVDERADVYAIGAILYHVITGTPPVGGKTVEEVLQKLLSTGATPLAQVKSAAANTPLDLVAIVDKAMAREPGNRYPTAKELADDLRKFQAGQFVGAYHYTFRQRAARFVRKHRIAVAVAAVSLAVVAVGSAYSVQQIVHERDAAVAARADAEHQRGVAEVRRKQATTGQQAAETLVNFILSDLKPNLERVARLDLLAGLGEKIEGYYTQLKSVEDLDDAAVGRRAHALEVLADVLDSRNQFAESKRMYEAALALYDAHPAGPETPLARARTRISYGIVFDDMHDPDGAMREFETGKALLDKVPKSAARETQAARAERWISIIHLGRGKIEEATAALDRAIERATVAMNLKDTDAQIDRDARLELTKAYDRRSDLRRASGNRAAAASDASGSLALRQRLVAEDPRDLNLQYGLAISHEKLFLLAIGDERLEDAERHAGIEAEIMTALVHYDTTNTGWRRTLLSAAQRPADIAYARDDFARAATEQARVVKLAESATERAPGDIGALADLANVTSAYADRLVMAKRIDEAIEVSRRNLTIYDDLRIRDPQSSAHLLGRANTLEALASAHLAKRDVVRAAEKFREALTVAEELARRDPANVQAELLVGTLEFQHGRAVANLPNQRSVGIRSMQQAYDRVKKLDSDGKLSAEATAGYSTWPALIKQPQYR